MTVQIGYVIGLCLDYFGDQNLVGALAEDHQGGPDLIVSDRKNWGGSSNSL